LLLAPAVVFTDDSDLIDNGSARRARRTDNCLAFGVVFGVSATAAGIGYGTAAVARAVRRALLVTITVAVAILTGACLFVRRYPPGRVRAAFKEFAPPPSFSGPRATGSTRRSIGSTWCRAGSPRHGGRGSTGGRCDASRRVGLRRCRWPPS